MTSPHYTHDFLISIAGINIGIYLRKNLQNEFHWRGFFSTRLKNCLIDNNSDPLPSYKVILTDSANRHINLPQVRGKTLFFSNLLHPNLLSLSLHPLLQRGLARKNTLSLHASGVATNGTAVLFCGISGSGKSTALTQRLEKSLVIGDDCLLVKKIGDQVVVFQSPFNDKIVVDNLPFIGTPVSKIVFINKQGPVKITKIAPIQALPLILSQLITPPYNITIRKLLLETSRILSQNAYQLNYSLGEDIHEIF